MRALAVAALLLLALPACASAGTVRYQVLEIGTFTDYLAAPGERNDVTVSGTKTRVTFHDEGAPIESDAGGACEAFDEHTWTCQAEDAPGIFLGDRDDRARALTLPLGVGLFGDEGDDVLRAGGAAGSALYGGPGVDSLVGSDAFDFFDGGGGPDRILGLAGDDHLNGDGPAAGVGTDVIDGGDGRDSVNYGGHHRPVTIDLRRTTGCGEAGENDVVRDVEDAFGGEAADRIFGDGGPNALRGGGGSDLIRAGGGDDLVWVNRRRRPRGDVHLNCGRGDDAVADMSSTFLVPESCERVRTQRFVVSAEPRRTSASELIVDVKQRQPRYGLAVRCRAVVELAGPYPAGATERPPAMGTGIARAPVGRVVSVRLRLNSYGRSLLAEPGRTRVLMSVDGEDSCRGGPHGRPHASFTLLL